MYSPPSIFTYLIFIFIEFILVVFIAITKSGNFALIGKITDTYSLFSWFLASYFSVRDVLKLRKYSNYIIFCDTPEVKISTCCLIYSKNESLARRPIHCMIIFENLDRNIPMAPLDLRECILM